MTSLASTFTRSLPSPKTTAIVAALLVIFSYIFLSASYLLLVVGLAAVYTIFCTGLNFFMGYTGQASFGQNAFAALGGYTSAIACGRYGWEPLAVLPLAMVFSALVAVVVGYPTLRLRGHYLAMATFALGLITYELSVEWIDLTNGYMGFSGIPPLRVGRWELSEAGQVAAILVVALSGILISQRLRQSRFGRALVAISGSEAAASSLGIDIARYKLAAFAIAAMYASAAGSLFAHLSGFISPEVFGLTMVILGFTMLYLGGVGTTWGPMVGAFAVLSLTELFRGLKEVQDLAYCSVLILILIFFPKGLVWLWSRWDLSHHLKLTAR